VTLVGVGVRFGVAVDGIQRPLGILVLYILILVLLHIHLPLALLLAGRRAVLVRLLLLFLAELLYEFFHLLALGVVAHRVLQQAFPVAVVGVGRLTGALVTTRATAPPAIAALGALANGLSLPSAFFFFFLLATTLSSGIYIRLSCFWSRRRMPGTTLYGPGALVH
jgi:hypothetical protein